MSVIRYSDILNERIRGTKASNRNGSSIRLEDAMDNIVNVLMEVAASGGKVIFIGNGGSASIASHMAVDFWKNGNIQAISFNDASLLTCISNDNGYENVFSIPINVFAKEGDFLVAISSSGSSPNILKAVDAACSKKCRIATLSGFKENNPLRKKGDINLFVEDTSYGIVETAHAMLLHYVMDRIIERHRNV